MSHKLLLTLTDYLYLNRFKGTPGYSKFVGTAPEVDQLDRKWVILNRKKKKDLWPNLNSHEYGLIVFIRFVIQLIKVKTNEQFIVSSIIFRTVPFHKNMFLAHVRVRVLRRKFLSLVTCFCIAPFSDHGIFISRFFRMIWTILPGIKGRSGLVLLNPF